MRWRGRGEWLRGGGRAGGSGKQRRGRGVSRELEAGKAGSFLGPQFLFLLRF